VRAYGPHRSQGPSWLVAIVIFAVLLIAVQMFRDRAPGTSALQEQFAAQPTPAGLSPIELPPLPEDIAGIARTALERLRAGAAAPALTPVAQSERLRVEIAGMEQVEAGLQITGSITNAGTDPLPVSLGAFQFTDGTGTTYAAQSDAATTLAPGQRAPLDLTLPIQHPDQLTLRVQLEAETPIEMVLLQPQ
jgi:hypothetical protein